MNNQFADKFPRAVEIPEAEYLRNKDEIDAQAAEAGYRFLGVHGQTKLCVWTSKP